jgi:hypothetical protein
MQTSASLKQANNPLFLCSYFPPGLIYIFAFYLDGAREEDCHQGDRNCRGFMFGEYSFLVISGIWLFP